MAGYQYPEIRKFDGLFLQANSFNTPDGAMETARNVEIQNDAIVQKTRGWYTYWTPDPGDEVQALVNYQDYLYAFGTFGAVVFFDNTGLDPYSPIGTAFPLSGDPFNLTYTSRFATQNKNLYFTTNQGIFKLEGYAAKTRKAGVPPALDLIGVQGTTATGPLPPNSVTGFRIVFGRRDDNENLLLGAPSDVAYIEVPAALSNQSWTRSGGGPYTVTVTVTDSSIYRVGQQLITSGDISGTQTIASIPGPTSFTFSVVADPGASGSNLDITASRDANFEASIPSEIDDSDDNWFYQVYRTSSSAGVDVAPTPDFALVAETNLSATDIDLGFITFNDDVDSLFVGAQLYTNPNSREGELQANVRPPKAEDIQLFKDYMLWANVTTRQRFQLQLIAPSLFSAGQSLKFSMGGSVETYIGNASGVRNRTVAATSVSGTGTVTITYASHGASNGWIVELVEVTGSVSRGTYTVSGVTANTFDITAGLLDTATAITFYFVSDGTNPVFYADTASASTAVQIANTTYYLVKAINRSSAYLYANDVSTYDDPPGRMRFESKFFELFPIYVAYSAAPSFQPFLTPLPGAFNSGVQISFDNDVLPNYIAISKVSEPESAPVLQLIPVGSPDYPIKRFFVLRDSVIILKGDGTFRLSGDTIEQFSVTVIDETVKCFSSMGAATINNVVHAITNQGLVAITESSVRIISRRIDDVIQFIVGSGDVDVSLGFGYESGRTFFFSVAATIQGRTNYTYLYNVFNESWTDTDRIFRNMCTGPDDILYAIAGNEGNVIWRQRKSQTLLDYSDEMMNCKAIATGERTATLTLAGTQTAVFTPTAGMIVTYNGAINRVAAVQATGGEYSLTFVNATNISDSAIVNVNAYEPYTSTVKFAPFHAGQLTRDKFFSQLQFHMRQPVVTSLAITFATAQYGSSEETDWEEILVSDYSIGWGYEPWGIFPWGLSEAIDLQVGTLPAIPVRILVPLYANRSTFIQPTFEHSQAGEPMLIQSISYAVRGYGERVSR